MSAQRRPPTPPMISLIGSLADNKSRARAALRRVGGERADDRVGGRGRRDGPGRARARARSTYPVLAKLGVKREERASTAAPAAGDPARAPRLGLVHRRQSGGRRDPDHVRVDAPATARSSRWPSAPARSSRRRAPTRSTPRRGRGGSAAPAAPTWNCSASGSSRSGTQAARWPGPDDHPGYRQAIAERMLTRGPARSASGCASGCSWLFAGSLTLETPRDWSAWDEERRR